MKIDVTLNLLEKTCVIVSDEEPGSGVLFLKIAESDIPADLERVNGTISASVGGSEISRISLDNLLATDQEVVSQAPCAYFFGDNVSVDVDVTIDEESISSNATFTVPFPEKPYESWTWNEELMRWYPTVPLPDPSLEHLYDWDEESLSWILASE